MSSAESSWVFFELKGEQFAIPIEFVSEMVVLSDLAAVPRAPNYARGVINLRGKMIPILDLRLRLGMRGAVEETEGLCDLLSAREQDHRDWLSELDLSVQENREFALARDPTQCAFGKWYASFHTEDPMLRIQLELFERPHGRIHELAALVEGEVGKGSRENARALIEKARGNELVTLLRLFAETRRIMREEMREIVIVTEQSGSFWGLVVDAVVGVKRVQGSELERPAAGTLGEVEAFLSYIGKIDERVVMMLAPEKLLPSPKAARLSSGG